MSELISEVEAAGGLPRVWIKGFWGFNPTDEGYVGFTKPSDQRNFIQNARRGDLVVIYGAKSPHTAAAHKSQVLGVLEIDPISIRDTDAASPEALKRKAAAGNGQKWKNAVPVLRAWSVRQKIGVAHLAPSTYDPEKGQHIATCGALLTDEEALKAFQLEVKPIPVFGRPVPEGAEPMTLERVFRPSRGFPVSFGDRRSQVRDGEHRLYVLRAKGDIGALLGRAEVATHDKILVKVGLAKDPVKRRDAHNKAIPPASVFKWELLMQSHPYPDGESAKQAEDTLKATMDAAHESLGGEFFLGRETDILSVFYGVKGVARSKF